MQSLQKCNESCFLKPPALRVVAHQVRVELCDNSLRSSQLGADALACGYEVVVANTDYQLERLISSVRLMIGRRVSGLAAKVSEMDPYLIDELTDSAVLSQSHSCSMDLKASNSFFHPGRTR